jgi:hypothetical protein
MFTDLGAVIAVLYYYNCQLHGDDNQDIWRYVASAPTPALKYFLTQFARFV